MQGVLVESGGCSDPNPNGRTLTLTLNRNPNSNPNPTQTVGLPCRNSQGPWGGTEATSDPSVPHLPAATAGGTKHPEPCSQHPLLPPLLQHAPAGRSGGATERILNPRLCVSELPER